MIRDRSPAVQSPHRIVLSGAHQHQLHQQQPSDQDLASGAKLAAPNLGLVQPTPTGIILDDILTLKLFYFLFKHILNLVV